MISANVVKAVQETLRERGIEQKTDERLGDYVARGLGISDQEAETFLELVHDGHTVEEAQAKAGITVPNSGQSLLTDIAKAIGSALGRITS